MTNFAIFIDYSGYYGVRTVLHRDDFSTYREAVEAAEDHILYGWFDECTANVCVAFRGPDGDYKTLWWKYSVVKNRFHWQVPNN